MLLLYKLNDYHRHINLALFSSIRNINLCLEEANRMRNLLCRYIALNLNFQGIILLPLFVLAKIRDRIFYLDSFICLLKLDLLVF